MLSKALKTDASFGKNKDVLFKYLFITHAFQWKDAARKRSVAYLFLAYPK